MKELKEGIDKVMHKGLKQNINNRGTHYITDKSLDNKTNAILTLFADYIKGKEELISIFLEPYIKSHYQKSDVKDIAKDIINILIGGEK